MALKLQTYKSEKLAKIIYKTLSYIVAIIFFILIISNLFITPDWKRLPLSSNYFLIAYLVFSIVYSVLYFYIKKASKESLWILSNDLLLDNTEILYNNKAYLLSEIAKIEVFIKGYKRNIRTSKGRFYFDGSKNYLKLYSKSYQFKTKFFLDNMVEHNELEQILEIYKQKTTVIVKT